MHVILCLMANVWDNFPSIQPQHAVYICTLLTTPLIKVWRRLMTYLPICDNCFLIEDRFPEGNRGEIDKSFTDGGIWTLRISEEISALGLRPFPSS